jgi:hypothetical protein
MPALKESPEKADEQKATPKNPRDKRKNTNGRKKPPPKSKGDRIDDCGAKNTRKKRDPIEVAKRKVRSSVPAIVDVLVEKAKGGSCTHAKTLLEMTGAKHMFENESEGQSVAEPWAKLVLERLSEAESQAASQGEAETHEQ